MTQPAAPVRVPRKILLATDLSARCDRALDRAALLAARWKAELLAVHALEQTEDFYNAVLSERLPGWVAGADASQMAQAQLCADLAHRGLTCRAVVEKGSPDEVILRVAEREGADLIVTGVARDEMLGRFGLGSTVSALMRRARVPGLVVRQRAYAPYQRILLATDFSQASETALKATLSFFPDGVVDVFHAYQPPASGLGIDRVEVSEGFRAHAAGRYQDFLKDAGIAEAARGGLHLVAEAGDPRVLVPRYARHMSVDLVVVGTSDKGFILDLFLGSMAQDILSALPGDVLVVPEA